MNPVRFIQHTDWLHAGDAVGSSIRLWHKLMRERGHQTFIVSQNPPPEGYGPDIHPPSALKTISDSGTHHMLHFAGCGYPLKHFVQAPGPKILMYHNTTPAFYFAPFRDPTRFDPLLAALTRSKRELLELIPHVDLALGVSRYNTAALQRLGYRNTDVIPLPIDLQFPDTQPPPAKNNGWPIIGAVGRIAPNKNLEQILTIFHYFRKYQFPNARLILVGSDDPFPEYRQRLLTIADRLRLRDALTMTGFVTRAELAQIYKQLDLYLSMSLHEGFAAPLLEAMFFNVPVIALARGAVAETMQPAGVLVHEAYPEHIAELAGILCGSGPIRAKIIDTQQKHLAEYQKTPFVDLLESRLISLRNVLESRR